MSRDLTAELQAAARAWVAVHAAGCLVNEITLGLLPAGRVVLPVPLTVLPAPAVEEPEEPFVLTPFQTAILKALEGKALRTDPLANKVNDRRRLFIHPGGLKELQEQGLVAHHKRLGFYRPDAPPPQLEPEGGAP